MIGFLSILAVGFFLGMRHATDPDHVIAVTTIVSNQRTGMRAALIGAFWGVGHTLTILVVGAGIILFNLVIPVRDVPVSGDSLGGGLLQNPAFWLRIGVGLIFPIILAVMAWRSSIVRGMMSATGLLYVATGAVLAGEALARGLQLATAIPF